MANLAYVELAQFARERINNPAITKKALSIALGIALSRHIPLPSSEVEHAESYYLEFMSVLLLNEAARFNENVVVDMDLTAQTARAFWLIRYYNVFPLAVIPIHNCEENHFMSALSGVGHLINPDTFALCQANTVAMTSIINKVRAVLLAQAA